MFNKTEHGYEFFGEVNGRYYYFEDNRYIKITSFQEAVALNNGIIEYCLSDDASKIPEKFRDEFLFEEELRRNDPYLDIMEELCQDRLNRLLRKYPIPYYGYCV